MPTPRTVTEPLSNHKLPIERGRYSNIQRERRFCHLCNENNYDWR